MSKSVVIDEHGLAGFRREHLAPEALLRLVDDHVHVLARVAVGVGKSHAVDNLLEHPPLFTRFDRVLYAAPTRSILAERRLVRDPSGGPVVPLLLQPRPRALCGDLDAPWSEFERRGCATYARATLCQTCPARRSGRCSWPDQLDKMKQARLLLMPEQYLLTNRSLVPMLRALTNVHRTLVVLDEAKLLDASFEVAISNQDLDQFRGVLDALPPNPMVSRWRSSIERLRRRRDLQGRLDFSPALLRDGFKIQQAGIDHLGPRFRNIAYDLALLSTSRPDERWRDGRGFRFIGRPLLPCHVLALSATHTGAYAGDRLGSGTLVSPLEHFVFRHSGTQILNLRSRLGADRYFPGNHRQILDTIALLIARNIGRGVTTLLISRKKSKQFCADYLAERLAGWGVAARFACEKYADLPSVPRPDVVPIIHYGIVGVNDFSDYAAAYCLNSYYVSNHHLSRVVQGSAPPERRATLGIRSGHDLVRHAVVLEGADPAGVLAHTANLYLQKLELDPVLQAAGRARFATRPREVLFFQMADLEPLVGPHDVISSLAELRARYELPDPSGVDRSRLAIELRAAVASGATVEQAAAAAGVSARTAYRRLADLRTARSPLRDDSLRALGSLPATGEQP